MFGMLKKSLSRHLLWNLSDLRNAAHLGVAAKMEKPQGAFHQRRGNKSGPVVVERKVTRRGSLEHLGALDSQLRTIGMPGLTPWRKCSLNASNTNRVLN